MVLILFMEAANSILSLVLFCVDQALSYLGASYGAFQTPLGLATHLNSRMAA
jgi:hypothetical protein